jgi:hypothetical protein
MRIITKIFWEIISFFILGRQYPAPVLSPERDLARPWNFYIQPGAMREKD